MVKRFETVHPIAEIAYASHARPRLAAIVDGKFRIGYFVLFCVFVVRVSSWINVFASSWRLSRENGSSSLIESSVLNQKPIHEPTRTNEHTKQHEISRRQQKTIQTSSSA
jgi:hypothetical protein